MGYTHGRMWIVTILHEWIWHQNADFLILKMQHIILISIFFQLALEKLLIFLDWMKPRILGHLQATVNTVGVKTRSL